MKPILYIFLILGPSLNAQTTTDLAQGKKMTLASRYLNGVVQPNNPERAFVLYKECADEGNPKAMNAVGVQYKNGIGVAVDIPSSFYWFQKSADKGYPTAWYNLGIMYKYGTGCEINYAMAYHCFKKAADLNDIAGMYSQGYMLYKGLGCDQNYHKAITLFKRSAFAGSASSMYFLGLCFRSGYGIQKNKDSAAYWLKLSAEKNYQFAIDEIKIDAEENSFQSSALLDKIREIQGTNTKASSFIVNKYNKIEHNLPAQDIEGSYSGYLVRFDYSGEYILNGKPLNVNLLLEQGKLAGTWSEEGTDPIKINASLVSNAVVFENTQYKKADRFDLQSSLTYQFDNASLQLLKDNDSIYLVGDLNLFVADKKEPEKPLSIILKRVSQNISNNAATVRITEAGSLEGVTVFPNPFKNVINIEFTIQKDNEVFTQLYSSDGRMLYTSAVVHLEAGKYVLPLEVSVPNGSYVVKLHCGNDIRSAIALKQ